jgi:putative transposase
VLGLVIAVLVTPANILDRHAAPDVLARAKKKAPGIKKVFVDSGYNGACKTKLEKTFAVDVEIVTRKDRIAGIWQGPQLPLFATLPAFQVLPRRWVVERTNAWTSRPRRLCKDQDLRIDVAEAWIWLTHGSLLMRRLAHATTSEAAAAEQPAAA